MTNFSFRCVPHDTHDIGFRQSNRMDEAHYFNSHQNSRMAISHCGKISLKSALRSEIDKATCRYCRMIEELREGMDG